MAIQFTCPQCSKTLRVGDENAGRKARCPQCSAVVTVPQLQAPVDPLGLEPTVPDKFYIDSVSGQTYGPVTYEELAVWVNEGRVSANCTIRGENEEIGPPASQLFPQLQGGASASPAGGMGAAPAYNPFANTGETPVGQNPYLAPSAPKKKRSGGGGSGKAKPVAGDLGQIFSRTTETFGNNVGILVGATIVVFIVNALFGAVSGGLEGADMIGLSSAVDFVGFIVDTFLRIGMVMMCLAIGRGRTPEFGTLFEGGSRFLPIIGFYLILFVPLVGVIIAAVLVGLASPEMMLVGIAGILFAALLVAIFIWPCYYLIVDRKATVLESFGLGASIATANIGQTIVLIIASFGIILVGFLALCIGIFFAAPYVSLLWAVAYQQMSGTGGSGRRRA